MFSEPLRSVSVGAPREREKAQMFKAILKALFGSSSERRPTIRRRAQCAEDDFDFDFDDDDDDDDDISGIYVGGKRYDPDRPRRPEWRPKRAGPEGNWRQITGSIEVRGLRKEEARTFITAAKSAEKVGKRFGIHPKRAPDNAYDSNAIELWGFVDGKEWLIGFFPKEGSEPAGDTKYIAETFPTEMPLAADLYKVTENGPYIDMYVILLGPGARDEFWKGRDDPLSKKRRKNKG